MGENSKIPLPLVLGLKQRDADVEGSAVVRALAAAVATSATFKSMVIENQIICHLHCFILPPLTQGGTNLKRTTMISNVKAKKNRNTLKR